MAPAPRQKLPEISPIFKADTVRLHVLREKDKEIALGRCRIGRYEGRLNYVIPNPIDQNPWAHWRSPMDMMRQGWSMSLFHAAQQWSTRSS